MRIPTKVSERIKIIRYDKCKRKRANMEKREKALEVVYTLFFLAAIEVIIGVMVEKCIHGHLDYDISLFALDFILLRIIIYFDDLNLVYNRSKAKGSEDFVRSFCYSILSWILYVASAFCLSVENGFKYALSLLLVSLIVATFAAWHTTTIDINTKHTYTILNIFYIICILGAYYNSKLFMATLLAAIFIDVMGDDHFKVLPNPSKR